MVAGGLGKETRILSYTSPVVSFLFRCSYGILWPELNNILKLGVDKKDFERSPPWFEERQKGPVRAWRNGRENLYVFVSSYPTLPGNPIIVWQWWPGRNLKLWGRGILYDQRNCVPMSMRGNPYFLFLTLSSCHLAQEEDSYIKCLAE